MLQADVRILARHVGDRLAPELRYLEHIGLIDRRDQLLPPARRGERDSRHALDFSGRVDERVHRTRPVAAARLTVVQPAGQFSHDQHIDAVEPVGLERRGCQQRRPHGDRPQIGIDLQQLPQREQARLGPQLARRVIQRGIADRAEQNGVAADDGVARCHGQWIVGNGDAGCANGIRRTVEAEIEALADGLEHAHGLCDDLRSDAVAGQNSDGEPFHGCSRSYSAMRGSSSSVRSISSRPRSSSSRRYGSNVNGSLNPLSSDTDSSARSTTTS